MANNKKNRPAPKPKTEQVKEELPVVPKAVVFNCKKVRARKSPVTAPDNIITELEAGTEVEILDQSNPGWTHVNLGDKKAWIMSDYLQIVE